jgi:hypothetical protein
MSDAPELVLVSLIGFGTTSSVLLGAAIGLYVPLSKRIWPPYSPARRAPS